MATAQILRAETLPVGRADSGYDALPPGNRLAAMTWNQVRDMLTRGQHRVVVPFGAFEEHGSHLPLEADALLGDRLGPLLGERLDALCAPTVPIGCSEHHMGRAGTLSLQPETLLLIVRDLVRSLAWHGFRTIVLLPTHAGNAALLAHAARSLKPPPGVRVVAVADMGALATALQRADNDGYAPADVVAHAGEVETSLLRALAPAAVRAHADLRLQADELPERAYVDAFLAECVKQLAAQGVTSPCASA
jgi:creatinine amidohydrolase